MEIEEAVGLAMRTTLATALDGVCAVYDHKPDNAAFPFVTFDRHIVQPEDDIAEPMSRHMVTLTVWSDRRGPKQVRNILGRMRRALHHADLTLSNGESVLIEVERLDATLDGDGKTYMGSALVSVLTDNKEI